MKNLVKNFNQFINEGHWNEEHHYSSCCGAPVESGGNCSECGEYCEPETEFSGKPAIHHDMYQDEEREDRHRSMSHGTERYGEADMELYEAKKKSRKEVLKDADEKYPNLKKSSMKKGLESMKGKDFKEKAKKNFGWADKPEAAAAAYMRKATGKEPRDI